VIIFNDEAKQATGNNEASPKDVAQYTAFTDPCHFLAHLLSYVETPPYLRKALFPQHPNLRTAGTLPSLDMPHHLRTAEWCDYREGVTVGALGGGTEVDVGLSSKRLLPAVQIPPGVRVTVKLDRNKDEAEVLPPSAPREEVGYYWGFTIRRCTTLSTIFTESPFDGGYDLCFGTSERGRPLTNSLTNSIPIFWHMLVVFGGVAGLETAARNDPDLASKGIDANNLEELFDHYINVLPGQGSRTIRTEEAVWLGLMGLRGVVENNRLAECEE
jgi:methyltransferase